MNDFDIRDFLDTWKYDPERSIRVLHTADGRAILQVRLPLGIEQYELDGRPDGVRPHGYEYLIDFVDDHKGLAIDEELFQGLRTEGMLLYYRYMLCFQVNDFARVIRDTTLNLRLCKILETRVERPEDRDSVLQFRPYILRMNAVATGMSLFGEGRIPEARSFLEHAVSEIESLDEVRTPVFQFERARSIAFIRSAMEQMTVAKDDSRVNLEAELRKAVENEDYERAAQIRDSLRSMPLP